MTLAGCIKLTLTGDVNWSVCSSENTVRAFPHTGHRSSSGCTSLVYGRLANKNTQQKTFRAAILIPRESLIYQLSANGKYDWCPSVYGIVHYCVLPAGGPCRREGFLSFIFACLSPCIIRSNLNINEKQVGAAVCNHSQQGGKEFLFLFDARFQFRPNVLRLRGQLPSQCSSSLTKCEHPFLFDAPGMTPVRCSHLVRDDEHWDGSWPRRRRTLGRNWNRRAGQK